MAMERDIITRNKAIRMKRTYKYNNQVTVISVFNIEVHPLTTILAPLFNSQIKKALQNGRVVAGCNTSVKNDIMRVY